MHESDTASWLIWLQVGCSVHEHGLQGCAQLPTEAAMKHLLTAAASTQGCVKHSSP
jgi:hypothetical protein